MTRDRLRKAERVAPIELGMLGRLARYERPQPQVAEYDRLLGEGIDITK